MKTILAACICSAGPEIGFLWHSCFIVYQCEFQNSLCYSGRYITK